MALVELRENHFAKNYRGKQNNGIMDSKMLLTQNYSCEFSNQNGRIMT